MKFKTTSLFALYLLVITSSFGDVGDIFKTELTKVHVQSFEPTGGDVYDIIKFTVVNDSLIAHSSNGEQGAIIWKEVGSGVVLKAFEPTGTGNDKSIIKIDTCSSGDWVCLIAYSHNGQSDTILKTQWKGTWVEYYDAGDDAIQGFEAYPAAKGDAILKVITGPLAVEMVGFDAIGDYRVVLLNWQTKHELNNERWILERSKSEESGYETIYTCLAQGPSTYTHIDSLVKAKTTYWYRLCDIDTKGDTTWHGPISANPKAYEVFKFALYQSIPNPFIERTRIRYTVTGRKPKDKPYVFLKVFDISGRVVKTLVKGNKPSGSYEIDYKPSLPQGIYFIRLEIGRNRVTRKLIVLK